MELKKWKQIKEGRSPISVSYFKGRIAYEDIIKAIQNFNEMYCIGEGGTRKVYKVEMQDSQVLAVKKLNSSGQDGETEMIKCFANEVAALAELRHQNILKLHGFCSQGEQTILVYEFIEKGSLANMPSREKGAKKLDWQKRIKIVEGVAYALSYMHHDSVPPIIHRDISSDNVLLNSEFEAKVSDFGTAKFLKPDTSNYTAIAGCWSF